MVSDTPAGDRKTANLFYSVLYGVIFIHSAKILRYFPFNDHAPSLYCVQGGANQGRHTDRHQADDLLPAGQHREDAGQVSNGREHKIINK